MTEFSENTKDLLVRWRERGHLNKWDIANAIDDAKDFHELKDLLKFLIVEDMIKIWKAED